MTQYLTFSPAAEAVSTINGGIAVRNDDGIWTDTSSAQSETKACTWIQGDSNIVDSTGDLHPQDDNTQFAGQRAPIAVVDLFALLSEHLGRQMSQEKIAYVNYLSIRLENSGNGNNNNEESVGFAGEVKWYAPRRNRIRAYRMYRTAWRMMQKITPAANLLFNPVKKYKALRLGMLKSPSGVEPKMPFQSTDPFTDVDDSYAHQLTIFRAYDRMKNITNSLNVQNANVQPTNTMWRSGRCTAKPDALGFTTGISNPKSGGPGAGYQEWVWAGDQISVMNGLLAFQINNSTVTNSVTNADWADEEFKLVITVGVKGWKGLK